MALADQRDNAARAPRPIAVRLSRTSHPFRLRHGTRRRDETSTEFEDLPRATIAITRAK